MYKNYRIKVKNTDNGLTFSISDYQTLPVVLVEGILLLGTLEILLHAYVKLKQFF